MVEVIEQAARPTKKGAVIMDTAGYDLDLLSIQVKVIPNFKLMHA